MSTKFSEREFAMQRPNTFTYKTRKRIDRTQTIPYDRALRVANPLLEIRRAQSFVQPGPLARMVPGLEELKAEEIRKFGLKVNISAAGLAEAISNKFLRVDKLDPKTGKKILDPITNKPMKENRSLASLFESLPGTTQAITKLLSNIESQVKTSGKASQEQLMLLQAAIYNAAKFAPQIANVQANVNLTNIMVAFGAMDKVRKSTSGEVLLGERTIPRPPSRTITIKRFLTEPGAMLYMFAQRPPGVSYQQYSTYIWNLAGEKNQNQKIDLDNLLKEEFWKSRRVITTEPIGEEEEKEEKKEEVAVEATEEEGEPLLVIPQATTPFMLGIINKELADKLKANFKIARHKRSLGITVDVTQYPSFNKFMDIIYTRGVNQTKNADHASFHLKGDDKKRLLSKSTIVAGISKGTHVIEVDGDQNVEYKLVE